MKLFAILFLMLSVAFLSCGENGDEPMAPAEPEKLPGIVIINSALEYVRTDMNELIQKLDENKEPDNRCEWSLGKISNDNFTEVDILIKVSAELKLDCGDTVGFGNLRFTPKSTSIYVYEFNVNWFAETGKDAISFFKREVVRG